MDGYKYFYPKKAASWWTVLDDILWPEKKIKDRIKQRAEGFAKAGIDTAINFGFHIRFDFSNYFSHLHGYFADVCKQLHNHGIKFIDHYSCNTIERPKNELDHIKLHRTNRHHVLLHHDPIAAKNAQYEGHLFNELCEIDVRDGKRGYSENYQCELFCHNNPGFLDMHVKYLNRLMNEVPLDGFQIDDMTDYAFLATCGCEYCKKRLKRDYGHDLPLFEDKTFWGNTDLHPMKWGNYNNPVFRDWLRMKTDSIRDHLKTIKQTIGDKPLMTCSSSTGPIYLNAVSLDLEKYIDNLDLIMLENCGLGTDTINWAGADAEAMQQKDIAKKMGNAPALALSYTIYEDGGYLGWSLSRFFGVSNWCSTLPGRLCEDLPDAMQTHDIISAYNNWEDRYSPIDPVSGEDIPEIRLVSNRYCRENGWRDENGNEHWTKAAKWSEQFVNNNIGYRFVRAYELEDAKMLIKEATPLLLDGLGCVSDTQFESLKSYLDNGGRALVSLPFGTHDKKGFLREVPLSELLIEYNYPDLHIIDSITSTGSLKELVDKNLIHPRIKALKGDGMRALRMRVHDNILHIHILNRALKAIAHPSARSEYSGTDVLARIESINIDCDYVYEIDLGGLGITFEDVFLMSPETGDKKTQIRTQRVTDDRIRIYFDLNDIRIYAVICFGEPVAEIQKNMV